VKTPEFLNKIKELTLKQDLDKKKLVIFFVAFAFFIYADFSFVLKAQIDAIRKTGPKIAKLKKDLSGLQQDIARIRDLERKQAGPAQGAQAAAQESRRILTEEEMPALLQFISHSGQSSGLKIIQISPSRDSRVKEESIGGIRLSPLKITVEAQGGYHALGKFIAALENAANVLSIGAIRVNRSESDYLQLGVEVEIQAYVKK